MRKAYGLVLASGRYVEPDVFREHIERQRKGLMHSILHAIAAVASRHSMISADVPSPGASRVRVDDGAPSNGEVFESGSNLHPSPGVADDSRAGDDQSSPREKQSMDLRVSDAHGVFVGDCGWVGWAVALEDATSHLCRELASVVL